MKKPELTEEEMAVRGEILAEVLNIPTVWEANETRYRTEWGTKSAYGLFLTVKRIMEGGE